MIVVTCIVLCVQRKHLAIVLTILWVPVSLIAAMLACCSLGLWTASDRVRDSKGQEYCLLEQFAFFDGALVLATPQDPSAFYDIYKPLGETWHGNGPIPFNDVPFRPNRSVPSQTRCWLSIAENGTIFGAFGEDCYFIYDPKNKTFYSPRDWSNMMRPLEAVPERYPRDIDWTLLADKSTPRADGNGRPSREVSATQPGQKPGLPVN